MAPKKPAREPGLTFGQKVKILMDRAANQHGPGPANKNVLSALIARETGESVKTAYQKVLRVVDKGQEPKLRYALLIARAYGESLDFLADADRDFKSRKVGDRLLSFVASLSAEQQDALVAPLSRPDVLKLLLGSAPAGLASRWSTPR